MRYRKQIFVLIMDHTARQKILIALYNRRQRTDIGKYFFVNRTVRLWNQLSAKILGTLHCKPNVFRKRVMKVVNVVN